MTVEVNRGGNKYKMYCDVCNNNNNNNNNNNSKQHSPSWEAEKFSDSQEITRILWNPKIHYCIQKCPLPVPIQTQLISFHTSPSHFLKIHYTII